MSYIEKILNEHQPQEIDFLTEILIVNPIKKIVSDWAGICCIQSKWC
jgi:hypothetical protein